MQDQSGKGSEAMLDFYKDLQLSGESSGRKLQDMKPSISELLKSIRESAQGLAESRAEDTRLKREICATLTAYTRWLDVTLEIPPEAIPKFYNAVKMFLSPQGDLVVIDGQGRVNSQALEECPTEVVLTVVWHALPKLQSKIDSYSKRLDERIEFLGNINEELKRLPKFGDEPKEESSHPGSERA